MPTPQESLNLNIDGELELKPEIPSSDTAHSSRTGGGELFIVDNSDETWKGLKYLHDWTEIASAFDIATGFFEIGALLALEPGWKKLDKIRILLGDEMTFRTRQALLEGLRERTKAILDASIENEKEGNDFLQGVPAILEGKAREEPTRGRFLPSPSQARRRGLRQSIQLRLEHRLRGNLHT